MREVSMLECPHTPVKVSAIATKTLQKFVVHIQRRSEKIP